MAPKMSKPISPRTMSLRLARRSGLLAIALLALAFAATLAAAPSALAAQLTITVQGLRNAKGFIEISVYDQASQWPDHPTPDHHQKMPSQAGSVTFVFDLPPGTYAAAGYHDENANGKFDKSFLGLPEEGYMLSNNAKPFLSAPPWEKVKFELPPSGAAVSMTMIYP
jgi:uncharacterized protein (DUF2141 family)